MLTASRIEEIASGDGVNRVAVENFLGTLDDVSYQEARMNMEQDARSYRWNYETQGAIRTGLLEHFFPPRIVR